MAVAVKAVAESKTSLEAGAPMPLFESHLTSTNSANVLFLYDVTADGKRFLINTRNLAASPPLTVVVNWTAGLNRAYGEGHGLGFQFKMRVRFLKSNSIYSAGDRPWPCQLS